MTTLRCALLAPLSGPLALYGRASVAALQLWADKAANLPPVFAGVDLSVYDVHPDPASAVRDAVATDPDIIFGPYGSSTTVAAAGATSRLVWNHGGATSRLTWDAFPNVVNIPAPASAYFAGAIDAVRDADSSARAMVIFHAGTGFARDVAAGAAAHAKTAGWTVRPIAFESGAVEAAAAEAPNADMLLVVGAFDDELTAARALVHRPWPAAGFVGAGVDEVLAALGDAREGLLGPAQWTAGTAPEPDEGPDAAWFAGEFTRNTGSEPAYPAAQAFACGVIVARCIRDAGGVDETALRAAATRLRCTTLFGRFALDPQTGLQTGHRVLTVQWQGGVRRVVWPRDRAEAPLRYPRDPIA